MLLQRARRRHPASKELGERRDALSLLACTSGRVRADDWQAAKELARALQSE